MPTTKSSRTIYKPNFDAVHYCYQCSDYGHLMESCPNAPQLTVYKGQMGPEPDQTQSVSGPLKAALKLRPGLPALDVLENTDVLASFLRARGVQPAAKLEENKKRMAEWAAGAGIRVNYIPEDWEPRGYSLNCN